MIKKAHKTIAKAILQTLASLTLTYTSFGEANPRIFTAKDGRVVDAKYARDRDVLSVEQMTGIYE